MKPVLYEPKATDFDNEGGIATLSDCKSLIVKEEANGSYTIEATFPITTKYAIYLEDVNYQIKCKPNDVDNYHIFYIYDHYKDMATGLLYIKAKSRTGKLGNRVVKKVVIQNKTGIEAMALLHDGMDLESDIEMFCDITSLGSTSFEVSNPLECIKGISGSLNQIYGGEIKHDPFRLSLLKRRGKDNVTTIRYRKNLKGLKLELNWDGLITRIFPYADLQNKDGETERIFGDAVDSQYIGNYDGEVYSRYIQFTEEQGVTDLNSLNSVAKKYFTSMNKGVDKPKVSADVEIVKLENNEKFADFRKLSLFDTFNVYHERYNIDLELTVNKIEYDSLAEQVVSVTAGDPKFTFFEEQQSQFTEVMKKVPTKTYNSVFIDYVTKIISGNDGGNVIWWPKNRPTDLFFVDGETLEDARQVLRINKSGIGFSSDGWQGPYKTAWTLDGVFVADFITAGVLRAIRVEGVEIFGSKFETTNDDTAATMRIENGLMQFFNQDNKHIALISASTLSGEKSLGMQVSSDNGQTNSFVINETNTIINHSKKVNVIAPEVALSGDVKVSGRLSLNGVDINTSHGGSGGGEWGGDYPSIVTTQAQKFAWEAWVTLRLLGYSEAAAAGILGNINGEVGPSMNPDTEQVGGPAYGAVQFDGSAYPLIGTPTDDGREYFQRLHNASRVGGDYREMSTQMKVVNWAAMNGQWIGKVSPQTIAGYKAETNPENAAYAFEENFERPANAHPERQGYARNWYDLFKGINITTSDKWTNPLHDVSYTVTQEWDQIGYGTGTIHGGIDLAPNGGATPPIYAARNGVVEQIVLNDPTGGNYVIVKHSDDYWTYYGHLNSVSVSQGDSVSTNTKLGICGATGLATGVHLHFEVWHGGQWNRINPRDVIKF